MSSDSNRSFDGGCFLFTCGCFSGGCLGVVLVGALATGLIVYSLQIGFIDNPRDFAYVHVVGDEMSPTLQNNDWVLIDRGQVELSQVSRGDIVWVEPPEETRRTGGKLLLRVAGIPGESVSFDPEGGLLINGEPRTDGPFDGNDYRDGEKIPEPIQLTETEFYLLGDEPSLAKDSRQWGPIAFRYLRGRADAILFPPGRTKRFDE